MRKGFLGQAACRKDQLLALPGQFVAEQAGHTAGVFTEAEHDADDKDDVDEDEEDVKTLGDEAGHSLAVDQVVI